MQTIYASIKNLEKLTYVTCICIYYICIVLASQKFLATSKFWHVSRAQFETSYLYIGIMGGHMASMILAICTQGSSIEFASPEVSYKFLIELLLELMHMHYANYEQPNPS